jgi:AcrR family transcriptional regulator
MIEKIDRRTTDTKERIIEEALQLYKQGGFAAVKLNDITKALHVTRAALYNHFPEGKEQILLEAFILLARQMEDRIIEILDSVTDTRQRLKEMLLTVYRTSNIIEPDIFFLAREELSPAMKKRVEEVMRSMLNTLTRVLQEGMERGDLRKVDLPLAFTCVGMLFHQVRHLALNPAKLPPELRIQLNTEDLIDQLLDLWFTGMGNPEKRTSSTETDKLDPAEVKCQN